MICTERGRRISEREEMLLFHLILVDDEPIVLKGIRSVFHLEEYGFLLCGAYTNPLTALEELAETKPDLIITDVKMPQMDGLSFSREVKRQLPDSEIVILSGHDNFSFAQMAVRLGASDYLLKPIKKKDFEHMLSDAAERLTKKQEKRRLSKQLEDSARLNYSILKNNFFQQLLTSGSLKQEKLRNLYGQLGFEFEHSSFILVKFVIYEIQGVNDFMSTIEKIISEFMQLFSDAAAVEEFYTDEYLYFLLYNFREVVVSVEELHERIFAFADQKEQEQIHLLTGVSDLNRGMERLNVAIAECDDGILTKHENRDHHRKKEHVIYPEHADLHIPSADIEELMIAVSAHQPEEMQRVLDVIYDAPAISLYRDFGTSITLMILLKMAHVQNKYQSEEQFLTPELLNIGYLSAHYPNASCQKRFVYEKAVRLSEVMQSQEQKSSSKIILAAVSYVNSHYSENISLSDAAEAIHISKNYLCDLFKKEMQVTFIDYVTNLRIEKAKYLLSHSDKKMYEISQEVGYHDYAYFSQIFKRHTGTTLSAYRRQHEVG